MARKCFFISMLLVLLALHCLSPPAPWAAGGTLFKITRLQIYFDNRRAEVVVPQNHVPFQAHVDLEFEGAGLLQGYWEVDGQIFDKVKQHLDEGKGGTITLTTPRLLALPTWRTGSHRLRFVLSDPVLLAQAGPEALYFVTSKQAPGKEIVLISPEKKATLDLAPRTFSWVSGQENAGYLVAFYDDQEKIIFSAYTKELQYALPPAALEQVFTAGQHYLWQVEGYDENLNKTASSRRQRFFFVPE